MIVLVAALRLAIAHTSAGDSVLSLGYDYVGYPCGTLLCGIYMLRFSTFDISAINNDIRFEAHPLCVSRPLLALL